MCNNINNESNEKKIHCIANLSTCLERIGLLRCKKYLAKTMVDGLVVIPVKFSGH